MYDRMQGRVTVGMKVRTLDGELLGAVKRVHGNTFEIERGLFLNHDHAMSLDQVMRIDGGEIVLSTSKKGFETMSGRIGTSFRDRVAGVVDHALAAIDDAFHAGRTGPPKTG